MKKSMTRRNKRGGDGTKKLDLPAGYNAHKFSRVRENGQLSIPVLDAGLTWYFQIADVPDFSDFANLYDAYVIDQVDITYILENNDPGRYPVLLWAPDYDDGALPTNPNQVTCHQNVKYHAFSENARSVTISVKPRALNAAYKPGVTSGYTWAQAGVICDMANTDIQHYGIKTWMSHYNTSDTPGARFRTLLKYHIRCIGQR